MLIKKSITFGVFLLFNTIYLDIFSSYAILILLLTVFIWWLLLGRVSVEGDWERHDLLLSHTCSLCPTLGRGRLVLVYFVRGSDCLSVFSFAHTNPLIVWICSHSDNLTLGKSARVLIDSVRASDCLPLFSFAQSEAQMRQICSSLLCQRVGQALFKSNDHIRGGSDKNEKEKVDICQQNKHY